MLRVQLESVKRAHYASFEVQSIIETPLIARPIKSWDATMALTLRSFLETFDQLRTRHRRRLPFLAPALERRRPRIAAEDYAARHSIEHTLDRKAELRRQAPSSPPAARRYHELLSYELAGLQEVVRALHSVTEGRELEEALAEAAVQIERLEVEIAWCSTLLERAGPRSFMG
jgi:hypothetical protein